MPADLRLTRIYGENVCSYRRFDLNLARRGLVLCTGINGSGKSTPWHGLTHLFFGWTSKGLRGRAMHNVHAEGPYLFRAEAEVRGTPYVFEEHGTDTKAEVLIYEGGINVTPAARSRAAVREILGWSRERFLSTCYLSQEHTHLLVEASRAERREYTRELFGLGIYKDLDHATKERAEREVVDSAALAAWAESITQAETELATLDSAEDLRARGRKAQAFLATTAAIATQNDDHILKLEHRRSRLELREQLEQDLATLPSPATEVAALAFERDRLVAVLSRVEAARKVRVEAEDLRRALEQLGDTGNAKELEGALKTVRTKLATNQALGPSIRKAEGLRSQLARVRTLESVADIDARIESGAARAGTLGREADDIRKRLETGVCPHCKRPWHLTEQEAADLRERLTAIRQELEPLTKDLHRDRGAAREARLRDEVKAALAALPAQTLEAWQTENTRVLTRERELSTKLKLAQQAAALRERLRNLPKPDAVEDSETVRLDLKRVRTELEQARAYRDLQAQIQKLPTGESTDVQAEIERVREQGLALIERRVRAQQVVDKMRDTLRRRTQLEATLTTQRERYAKAQDAGRRLVAYRVLQKGWKHLLEVREKSRLARIQALLANYLEPLYGRQSRWLRVSLVSGEGLEPVLYSCNRKLAPHAKSPGQAAKLSLGMLFALRDYYGSGSSLLVLDEPIFRIDPGARAPFYGILERLRAEIETIFLISHESELTGCAFDTHIEARIDNGISTLVEA